MKKYALNALKPKIKTQKPRCNTIPSTLLIEKGKLLHLRIVSLHSNIELIEYRQRYGSDEIPTTPLDQYLLSTKSSSLHSFPPAKFQTRTTLTLDPFTQTLHLPGLPCTRAIPQSRDYTRKCWRTQVLIDEPGLPISFCPKTAVPGLTIETLNRVAVLNGVSVKESNELRPTFIPLRYREQISDLEAEDCSTFVFPDFDELFE